MSSPIEKLFSKRDLELLQSEAPTPLYFQMYSLLKSRILDGSIAHGIQMPTEQQLAEMFGVSRITAKRAMDELAADELVERRRGKGSHVTHHYEPEPVQAPLVGMLEKLASMGRQTRIKVLDVEKVIPPADIRAELDLAKGEKAHRVIRVRSSEEGEPFAYYISWTVGIKKGFSKRELESNVRLDTIKENGLILSKVDQYLGAEAANNEVARELEMKAGAPTLTLVRHSYTNDGKLVDILFCQYNPKRFQYRMSLSMNDYHSE